MQKKIFNYLLVLLAIYIAEYGLNRINALPYRVEKAPLEPHHDNKTDDLRLQHYHEALKTTQECLEAVDLGKSSVHPSGPCHREELRKTWQEMGTFRWDVQLDVLDTTGNIEYSRKHLEAVELPPSEVLDRVDDSAAEEETDDPEQCVNESTDFLPADQVFKVDLTCTVYNISVEICDQVMATYIEATTEIGEVLQVRKQINVDAHYGSFCEMGLGCGSSILGQASATSYVALSKETAYDDVDLDYVYPIALAKQLGDLNMRLPKYDIYNRFNADDTSSGQPRFYFRSTNKTLTGNEVKDKQFDLKIILMHEIIHGMGFSSSWGLHVPGSYGGSRMLSPNFNFRGEMVNGLMRMNIFDKFVHDTMRDKPLSESFFLMTRDGLNSSQSYRNWAELFEKSGFQEEGKALYEAATTAGGMEFRVPGQKSIRLFTARAPFAPGTSLSHVDNAAYSGTQEYLMRPYANNGEQIEEIDHDTQAIGPSTLEILKAIGWRVKEATTE